jgi:hypothetical protein
MLMAVFALASIGITNVNAQSGIATVQIKSTTIWSGSILDSSFDSATEEGRGNKNFTIVCDTFGIYSLAFQKQIEKGGLYVSVIQDGNILDSKSTTAPYGMVTLAGSCN